MGFLPSFLAIFGFVFLWVLVVLSSIKARKNDLEMAISVLRQHAQQRKMLAQKYLKLNDTAFLDWPATEEDAHKLLHQQDATLDKIDEAAVKAHLDGEGITAFKQHLQDSQVALENFHQLVHSYNQVVSRPPSRVVAKLFGYSPA